ncbi:MAG TPA: ATP-binding cassette domain-containing protein, partial [Anaerolineae bacterium]|nr:ATP-binding cassette domain-containing protein [Anaerolineae bacterium]
MKSVCELVSISKRYAQHVVLDKMNLAVSEGEMVAITGKSGSGKTTVLNIMGLLERPDSGIVRLFGEPSPRIGSAKATKLLRTRLSYLFQNCALIDDDTVDYNLEIPLIYVKGTRREKQT